MAFIFSIFTVVLNVMVYVADLYTVSGLKDLLAASPRTPWGIVTSFFVHADEVHLLNNMVSLFLFLMLFVGSNAFLSKKEVKMRIASTLLAIFSVPATLNFFVLIVYPYMQIIGSSGIVYTLEGMCLGFSLLNALQLRRMQSKVKDEKQLLLVSSLFNLAVVVGFLLSLSIYPLLVFGGRYETALWFHAIAFSCGFLSAMSYPIWNRQLKILRKRVTNFLAGSKAHA